MPPITQNRQDAEIPSPALLEWRTREFRAVERGPRWYLVGGVLVLAFAAYGLFDGSWTTVLLALMIGGLYFLLRNVRPREITVQITGMGLRIGGAFTPWNLCRDFWILIPPRPNASRPAELHIAPQKFLSREIVILLEDINPAAVRETLLKFLPERPGMEERFLDMIGRVLKL